MQTALSPCNEFTLFHGGKSGQQRATHFLTGRPWSESLLSNLGDRQCHRKRTALNWEFTLYLGVRVKWWGKSSPLWWWHQGHGKPCVLKDQIGFVLRQLADMGSSSMIPIVIGISEWVGWSIPIAMLGLDKWWGSPALVGDTEPGL